MVYGCGNKCIKFFLFVINLLLCLFGGLVFGFSLWANLDKDFSTKINDFIKQLDPTKQLDDLGKYQASLWILVAIGGLLFLVGFLGCCGAWCESPVLLSLFFFVVAICTILELAATIFAITNKDSFKIGVHEVLDKCGKESETCRKNLAPIEDVLHCCGATKESMHLFGCDAPEKKQLSDCETVFYDVLESNGHTVIVLASVLLLLNLLALTLSCVLCRASREVRYAGYYS